MAKRSPQMKNKPIFLQKYNNSSDSIRKIVDAITSKLIERGFVDWGYTDKPDLRFPCLDMVFCKFELYPPNKIKMFIRVDDMEYITALEKVSFSDKFIVSKRDFVGKRWIETVLYEDAGITPLLSIIHELSEVRVQSGW